ncbi:MAG: twin-arginine translocase subunit TatC, partial [Cyanobium sp.]
MSNSDPRPWLPPAIEATPGQAEAAEDPAQPLPSAAATIAEQGPEAAAPPSVAAAASDDDAFPGEVEMTLVEHLEELRSRLLRSLLALVIAAAGCLLLVKPLVRWLEVPAQGIRFL